ncbi:hypothetical protein IOD16_10030 [Saccharothrix sp. 6-C]|uniref:DUF6182 family protein n=1 Tax=Saccharothrix sp. 6-C TaxID=2781735 RepID=UPI0019170422|nr:DUF6182 family protein [Saccharothrix sp. 6-C]QQQ78747.1 hypothetical protein IOD16_10030 [Saccharothrix sp. 6-C]
MTVTQALLHDHVVRRIARARPDLAAWRDLSTVDGLSAVEAEIAAVSDTAVVAVVGGFDLVEWVRGTVAFAASLSDVDAWRRSFTKTLFLAGNPARLTGRFAFRHVAGRLAWTDLAPADAHLPLRQLLRAFVGERELDVPGDVVIDLPGPPGRHRVLHVAGAMPVARAMVHLNHLLVEAVFDGVLAPGDRLTVRRVPRLIGVTGPFDALRVGVDPASPGRLHALMALTEEVSGA